MRPDREAINRCPTCDHNGLIEILPPDQHNHATVAHCPHSAIRIIEIKRDAETQRAAHTSPQTATPATTTPDTHQKPAETPFRGQKTPL